jgi:hypothetical protein
MQASASDPALGTRAPAVAAQLTATLVPASRPRAQTGPYRYAWPLKPFHAQHPVRGFFGDPRISNHQRTKQFHFGVDISAPNDTPVYATLTGRISIHPRHPHTVGIVGRDGQEQLLARSDRADGRRAIAFRTVVGGIGRPTYVTSPKPATAVPEPAPPRGDGPVRRRHAAFGLASPSTR